MFIAIQRKDYIYIGQFLKHPETFKSTYCPRQKLTALHLFLIGTYYKPTENLFEVLAGSLKSLGFSKILDFLHKVRKILPKCLESGRIT